MNESVHDKEKENPLRSLTRVKFLQICTQVSFWPYFNYKMKNMLNTAGIGKLFYVWIKCTWGQKKIQAKTYHSTDPHKNQKFRDLRWQDVYTDLLPLILNAVFNKYMFE